MTMPGGKPVMAVPGLRPRLPETTEAPVLVMVEPARTANEASVPNPTGAWAAEAAGTPTTAPRINMVAVVETTSTTAEQRCRGRVNIPTPSKAPGTTAVSDDHTSGCSTHS